MFLTIYNIYIESLMFIRKNIFVVLPFAFYYVFDRLIKIWFYGDTLPETFVRGFIPILVLYFVETTVVIIVFRKEEIINSKETVWKTLNHFSGYVLLLYAYFTAIVVVSSLIFSAIFVKTPALINLTIGSVVLLFVAIYPLSLRYLIYYKINIVFDSIKAGFRELFKNFFFYLFVFLIGILVVVFPSLISPSTWFTFPFLPIAELSGLGSGNGINWIRLFLDAILSTLTSVALTYAFILKNKKVKHV